jgi:hypothetical protein
MFLGIALNLKGTHTRTLAATSVAVRLLRCGDCGSGHGGSDCGGSGHGGSGHGGSDCGSGHCRKNGGGKGRIGPACIKHSLGFMPRMSERAKLLQDLQGLKESAILYGGERRAALYGELMGLEVKVTSSRYLSRPTRYKHAPSDLTFENWISDFRIHHFCHMHRAAFDYVYSLARRKWPLDVFSIRKQKSIRFQVFIALARLASSDTGSTISKLMCMFSLSHGSVLIFAERFIEAFLNFEQRFVRWPSARRRRQLGVYGGTEFGFDGLIGSMDGTHFYLKRAPRFGCFPEAYFDTWHKGGYGYNCLLTADHTGTIIASLVGWPGSQCDTVLQPHTELHANPWAYLEKGEEFIFVDCGFSRQMYCVPPYKAAAGKLQHNKVGRHHHTHNSYLLIYFCRNSILHSVRPDAALSMLMRF